MNPPYTLDAGERILDAWHPYLEKLPPDAYELVTLAIRQTGKAGAELRRYTLNELCQSIELHQATLTTRLTRAGCPNMGSIIRALRFLCALNARDVHRSRFYGPVRLHHVCYYAGCCSPQSFARFTRSEGMGRPAKWMQTLTFADAARRAAEERLTQSGWQRTSVLAPTRDGCKVRVTKCTECGGLSYLA